MDVLELSSDLALNISSEPLVHIRKSELRKKSNASRGKNKFVKNVSIFPREYTKVVGEFDSGLDSYTDDCKPNDRRDTSTTGLRNRKANRPAGNTAKGSDDKADCNFKKPDQNLPHKRPQTSSLFRCNPDIPHIRTIKEEVRTESLFSAKSFSDLQLHPHLVSCLQSRFNITTMTNVQAQSIPILLKDKDALVKSCTGSGKTLAFAVPIVQKLQEIKPDIKRADGVYALIILPTRELVLQSFDCFSKLTKAFTRIVPGYLIGGEKKKSEKSRIRKGINILISTPGRLLDHLEHTTNLSLKKIEWLVIDEADRLFEEGFEEAVLKIVQHCSVNDVKSEKRHTVLLSATLSRGVEKLAGISMQNPVFIDISDENSSKMENLVVPSQLKQHVTVTPTKLRLVTLSAFILDTCAKGKVKALIFMCTQNVVDFHFALFNNDFKAMLMSKDYKVKFFKLHGNMSQEDRTEVFHQFSSTEGGFLLCTDVASRGLDVPEVDWIIQYDVPQSVESYVHKVGRTARIGKAGQSLLFLVPSEIQFLSLLQTQQLNLQEIYMNTILSSLLLLEESSGKYKQHKESAIEFRATNLQLKFEDIVYSEKSLYDIARGAYLSYIQAYASYPKPMRRVIPFRELHLGHAAKSFCLRESPSQLGCHFAKTSTRVPFRKHRLQDQKEKNPIKRKTFSQVSEFGSGLDSYKDEIIRKKKRKN